MSLRRCVSRRLTPVLTHSQERACTHSAYSYKCVHVCLTISRESNQLFLSPLLTLMLSLHRGATTMQKWQDSLFLHCLTAIIVGEVAPLSSSSSSIFFLLLMMMISNKRCCRLLFFPTIYNPYPFFFLLGLISNFVYLYSTKIEKNK